MEIENMSLEEIWNEISAQLEKQPELIGDLNATYEIEIKDEEKGKYGLIFQDGTAEVIENGVENPDCSLSLGLKNFKKLLQGDLNSTAAFMTGKLKVKGNIGLALKLENLLKKYSF